MRRHVSGHRGVGELIILVALSVLGIVVATAFASPGTSLSISPHSAQVSPGDAFDLQVVIESDVAARGAQCSLSFDPALVQVTGVAEGSFFSDWAAAHGASTLLFPEPEIDNVKGTVSDVGVAVMGAVAGGATGSGTFLIYHLQAVQGASGQSAIALGDVQVTDRDGNNLSGVVVNQGEVQVGPTTYWAYVPLVLRAPAQ